MHVQATDSAITVATTRYRLEVTSGALRLRDPRSEQLLIDSPSPLMIWPTFSPELSRWRYVGRAVQPASAGPAIIEVRAECDHAAVGALTITLRCHQDHIEFSAACEVRHEATVAHWQMLAAGAKLDLFHVHHWRSRHGNNKTYETHNLHQGHLTADRCSANIPPEMVWQWTNLTDISTFSTDFQFAPRPSLLVFQRDRLMLGIGSRDLPHGFGLELKAAAHRLSHLRLNYGGEHGQKIAAGDVIQSPRMYLWFNNSGDLWRTVDQYVGLLQEDGVIPRLSPRNAPHWWLAPMYCTWNDQGYLAGNAAFYNWPGDGFQGKNPVEAFDGPMLDHLLDVLEREQYPVGSVIIDDGWQTCRGHWRAHPTHFPNLRQQIDRIHAMGLRAILWMAPMDVEVDAPLRQRKEWLASGGAPGKWDMPLIDYSNPRTQEEYVRPMARYFFSSEPDCLNADGLKVDFMADKVHPGFGTHDPSWRGEERFLLNTQRLLYDLMKSHKPDAMLLGCTAHPFFGSCQDLIRTFDVPDSQQQHVDRWQMLRHFNPGNLISLDLSETRSLADVEEHLRMAVEQEMLYELARIAPNPATGEFELGNAYIELVKRKLAAWPNAASSTHKTSLPNGHTHDRFRSGPAVDANGLVESQR